MEPPPIQYATTSDGLKIAYRDTGRGRPLVLTPFPFNNIQRMWRQHTNLSLYEPLSQRLRLVHYDSRGQGMSSRDLGPDHSYDDYMLDLEAVVQHLRLDRFVLWGGPLSGHTAIRYAVRHPERIRALVLAHVPIDNPLGGVQNWEELARTSWETTLTSFIGANVRIGDQKGDAASRDYFRETITQEGFLSMCRACRHSNVEAILPSVERPTLVVDYAFEASAEAGQRIAAAIPNARLRLNDMPRLTDLYTQDGSVPPIVHAIEQFLDSLDDGEEGATPASPGQAPAESLTQREVEVLRLIAQGRSNQQIADELVLSVRTVERHITNLYAKIGAHGKADATAYALRNSLI